MAAILTERLIHDRSPCERSDRITPADHSNILTLQCGRGMRELLESYPEGATAADSHP
jgi:hypothetical protein